MAGEVHQLPVATEQARPSYAMVPQGLGEARGVAKMIADSNLFGCKTEAQAFSLMLLADAEGLHPATAARDYHIIQGRPSLRSDAMLARFQAAGGSVEWGERSDQKVEATFSHPKGGTITVDWTWERATEAGLTTGNNKATWKKYPRQMLSARVISEGVRTVFPGVVAGLYTEEEIIDFDAGTAPASPPKVKRLDPAPQASLNDPIHARQEEEPQGPSMEEEVSLELDSIIAIEALEKYLSTISGRIAAAPAPVRKTIQEKIREARARILNPKQEAEPEPEAPPVQEAEFEEKSADPGPAPEPQPEAKKELTDEEFVDLFIQTSNKAPSADNMAKVWERAEERLNAIADGGNGDLYERAATAWQNRFDEMRGKV